MQLVSNSERIRTIEKSTAERSCVVALRRAQARTAPDLLLAVNCLAHSRHIAHLVACRESPCADNLLGARPCRGLLSCLPLSHQRPLLQPGRRDELAHGNREEEHGQCVRERDGYANVLAEARSELGRHRIAMETR